MACTKETVKASGLNIWHTGAADGSEPEIDIIAVQGLGAHEYYTWVKKEPFANANKSTKTRDEARPSKSKKTQKNDVKDEDGEDDVLWLRDLLPPKFPNARIASYSYKSDWRDNHVKTDLRECANQFLNILYQERQLPNERQRPLLLIGHSLGSLVIQQALVLAVLQPAFADVRLSVAGIIFLGGPFQGSDAALFGQWLAKMSGHDTTLLEMLRKRSPDLYALSTDFYSSHCDFDLICFYEKEKAKFLGIMKAQIVDLQSASLLGKRNMSLDANHSGLNKFGRQDQNFELVLKEITRMAQDGAQIVASRHLANGGSTTIPGNLHWIVPRPVNNLFTGRTELLFRIKEALSINSLSTDERKIFVITGLGGQGKSEICLKVATMMRKEFWGIFWVNINTPSTAANDFIAIAKALGHSVENIHDALQVLANEKRNWLLILDNADDPEFDYQVYLPSGTHGAIIITSRISECRVYNTVGFEAIEPLDDQDSQELLFKAAKFPRESWPLYESQATEILRLLGSHTLALTQAGAYIAKGHCKLHEYPKEFKRQRKRLLKFRPKQAQSTYGDVYATFEASADVLKQSKSEAASDALQLLGILSMLDSSVLPLQIFQSAWGGCSIADSVDESYIELITISHVSQLPTFVMADSDEWDSYRLTEAKDLLASLSLVTEHDLDGSPGVSMHPLAHAWAKDRQDSTEQSLTWIATGCVLELSQFDIHTWQKQERRLLPHIQTFVDIWINREVSLRSKPIVIPIIIQCGYALQGMRQDMRPDSKLHCLLKDIFAELGIKPEEFLKEFLPLYGLQARSLADIGHHGKAVELLEHVVKIKATALAEDHPNQLASQHELAVAYRSNGQVNKAVELLEHVVKIKATTLAKDHLDQLAPQHALAIAYRSNGQVKEAVELLEHVVKIKATALAEDHPNQLASQHELAIAYRSNGQVKEAVELLEHVVKIQATALAEDHPDRLASQHALATAYRSNGQVNEAVELLEHVVKIQATTLAEDHPSRLSPQHALANAYWTNGQMQKAVELLEHVVKIQATTLAEDHPSRLSSQHALAVAYQSNKQVNEAVELLEHVVKIKATALAEDHLSRLASQHALAVVYQSNKQLNEAVELLEHVVKIKATALAEDHPSQLASQHALATAYRSNGQVNKAVELLEHVVKIEATALAEDHPSRLSSQHALACAYDSNGQVNEAVELLKHVVKIQATILAEDHPDRLLSQRALAAAYRHLNSLSHPEQDIQTEESVE
ncbi:hypothetical protein V490_02429 [Pseudogymnoascus sp. VKM F-3557]|nr:hypothetical protein V490_02429 [Pseudogymnoascus sp. VKM F-3557]